MYTDLNIAKYVFFFRDVEDTQGDIDGSRISDRKRGRGKQPGRFH